MKKLLLTVLIAGASFGTQASDHLIEKVCQSQSEVAYEVMSARQRGVPIGRLLPLSEGDADIEQIMLDAYQVEKLGTQSNREVVQRFFSKMVHERCLRQMGERY